jgi:uncharacterized protein YjhX (UPF0386 family)
MPRKIGGFHPAELLLLHLLKRDGQVERDSDNHALLLALKRKGMVQESQPKIWTLTQRGQACVQSS